MIFFIHSRPIFRTFPTARYTSGAPFFLVHRLCAPLQGVSACCFRIFCCCGSQNTAQTTQSLSIRKCEYDTKEVRIGHQTWILQYLLVFIEHKKRATNFMLTTINIIFSCFNTLRKSHCFSLEVTALFRQLQQQQ